jgi:outer membrane protein OmpA-like peptidoglycan-associated protein
MKTTMAVRIFTGMSASLLACAASAQTTSQPSATPVVQKVSVKGTAHFDFDRASLNTDEGAKLMAEVRSMKNVTWQTISVTGHADSVGPDEYNEQLSARRAREVQDFLLDKGVKPEKIRLEAQGEKAPIADNTTAPGRAQNRRVEIEFVGLQALAQ